MLKVKKNTHWLLCLALYGVLHQGVAQQPIKRDPILSANGHFGFIIAHHDYLDYLIRSHIGGVELNLSLPAYGEKAWERVYRFPEKGITYTRMWLGNPEELGNLHGLQLFLNFPLQKREKCWLYMRASSGISYIDKHFDRLENHKNIAIGSAINPFVCFRLNSKVRLSENLRMETGFGLSHFSNGSYTIPNLGINMVTASLGLGYHFNKQDRPVIRDSVPPAERKMQYNLVAYGGIAEIEAAGGGKFSLGGLTFNAYQTRNHKTRLGGGVDIMYNNANIEKFRRDTITLPSKFANTQAGLKLGWELTVSKVSLGFEMGAYVYSRYKDNGPVYHRLSTRYRFHEHWNAHYALKTHFAKADYFEFGLGYIF